MKTKLFLVAMILAFAVNRGAFTINAQTISFAEKLQSYLEKDDINGAIKLYDTIPANLANDVDLKLLHASLLISVNRLAEAGAITKSLMDSGNSSIDVLEMNAEIAMAGKNKTEIANSVKTLLDLDPYNPVANNILEINRLCEKSINSLWVTTKNHLYGIRRTKKRFLAAGR